MISIGQVLDLQRRLEEIETAILGSGAPASDAAYGPSWDGVTTVPPSKNAVYDKIETLGGGAYTDEQAQDAVGSMVDGSLVYVDGTPLLQRAALVGDVTASAGSNTLAIAAEAVGFAELLNAASAGFIGATAAGDYAHRTPTEVTAALDVATAVLKGLLDTGDKLKLDADLTAVHMTADAASRGAAIADYFASAISLEANSTYEIECHAHFLKTTAGTIVWTWAFSSAPTMFASRNHATPVTGYTGAAVTGAPIHAQATSRGQTTNAHAASGSLTTAVDHSFLFWAHIRTNAATTIQLRSTESAGTITPRAGSYMRARKIL